MSARKKTLYKRKCKATTRKNIPCSNFAMKGSAYCYVHSFGRIEKIPLWRNSTFHFIAGILVAVGIFIYSQSTGPTRERQEYTAKKVDETKRLLEIMIALDKSSYPSLIKKYPLGYILFAVDHIQTIIPYESRLLDFVEIDWASSYIAEITDKEIKIDISNILIKKQHLILKDFRYVFPLIEGQVLEFPFRIKHVHIYGETLLVTDYGTVFIVGFREK